MVTGDHAAHAAPSAPERSFPPIAEMAIGSMALIIIGGIYVASYVPMSISLAIPIIALVAAVILLIASVTMLRGLQDFAWGVFRQIFQWALLAYIVIAGMIGYVFVVDGTPHRVLVVLLSMLVVFAVDIPMLLAFSVARYQEADAA